MKLDFPTAIFDGAIEISQKRSLNGSNSLDKKLSELLTTKSKLDLVNVPFFKVIFSMIMEVQETIWLAKKQAVGKGTYTMGLELTRVFKSLS